MTEVKLPSVWSLDPTSPVIKVIEIYNAFQGEGLEIGRPCVFVRLAGCTVGCKWCDTKFSWKAAQGKWWDPKDLAGYIRKMAHGRHVVITGGEPLEHPTPALGEFMTYLLRQSERVTIETSGTGHSMFRPEDLIEVIDTIEGDLLFSISPKLPSSQSTKDFPNLVVWGNVASILGAKIQIKPVIMSEVDFEVFLDYMSENLEVWAADEIIFQIGTNPKLVDQGDLRRQILEDTKTLMDKVSSRLHSLGRFDNIRVLPQLHTLIYGQKRGV